MTHNKINGIETIIFLEEAKQLCINEISENLVEQSWFICFLQFSEPPKVNFTKLFTWNLSHIFKWIMQYMGMRVLG